MFGDRCAHSRHADARRILIESAIDRGDGGGKNFRRPVEVRRTLAEIHGIMLPGQIIDLDKNRRAETGDPLRHH